MTREQIMARIDALEALADTEVALRDVQDTDCERDSLDLHVSLRSDREQTVAFALGLPQSVVIAGLRAMQRELMAMAGVVEAA